MSPTLAEGTGLIASYRAGLLAVQRSAARPDLAMPPQKLTLLTVSYEGSAARSPSHNRVTRVAAVDPASSQITVAHIDWRRSVGSLALGRLIVGVT
jgi:hypothetical protein